MNDPRPLPTPRADDADVASRVASTVRADVRSLSAYPVPKTDGCIQLHANENPYPLPAPVRRAVAAAVARVPVHRYPDGAGDVVKAALAAALPLPEGAGLVLGNGSDELIQLLTTVVARPGASVLAPEPTFVMYRIYAKQAGIPYVAVPLRPDFTVDEDAMLAAIARERPALVWLASPNNPTGYRMPVASIERILAAAPGVVVVDEAYADFGDHSLLPRVLEFANLVLLRTLSKVGLAGVRLGYAVAHPAWIAELDKVRSPYNVNALTQAVVPVVLASAGLLAEQVAAIRAERSRLAEALAARAGVTVFPSEANFLLVRVPDADAWAAHLRARRILVKNLNGSHRALEQCLRITVGTPEENGALLAALGSLP
ncbi:MAG: histidinol-phosphate transaminase [Burkholderiales bacterium]|nr:histidinol-phosphate transaminase [Burkholderiales bacterium]GIK87581.1 MAG: histidinol-phosphate aminotransferase 1 [Betaproteobacteria bacterium]